VLSAAIYLLQDFVLPYANQRQDQFHDVIKGRAPQTYRDPKQKWMVGSDDRIYNYTYFDPNQNLFGGISIFAFKPKTFELTEWVFASRAVWNGSAWMFENGWIRQLRPNGAIEYQAFEALEFADVDSPDYFKKDVRTAAQMTYPELKRYVSNLRQSGFDASALMVDL